MSDYYREAFFRLETKFLARGEELKLLSAQLDDAEARASRWLAEVNRRERERVDAQKERDAWAHQCNIATESLHDWQSKFSAMSLVADDHAMARVRYSEQIKEMQAKLDCAREAFKELKAMTIITMPHSSSCALSGVVATEKKACTCGTAYPRTTPYVIEQAITKLLRSALDGQPVPEEPMPCPACTSSYRCPEHRPQEYVRGCDTHKEFKPHCEECINDMPVKSKSNDRIWISKTSLERFIDRRSGSVEMQNFEPMPEYSPYWDEYVLAKPTKPMADTPIVWPTHKCGLHLAHNQHKDYYERIDKYTSEKNAPPFKDEAARQRAIATDEIWELHWYPHTPIDFLAIAAPTLGEVLAWASEIDESEKDPKA